MAARPADLVTALDRLLTRGTDDMLGAFAVGPTFGTDYLPSIRSRRCATAPRTGCPSSSATTPRRAGCSPGCSSCCRRPRRSIELLLGQLGSRARERITSAYPGYPSASACVRLGGDFAFGTAAWQIAEAHSRHAPTYVYRYDYAPRTLQLVGAGRHARHGAVRRVRHLPHPAGFVAHRGRRPAVRAPGEPGRAAALAGVRPHGVPGEDWPLYTADRRAVLVFDRKPRIEFDPDVDRRRRGRDSASRRGSAEHLERCGAPPDVIA